MYSVIVAVADENKFENVLLPSLEPVRGYLKALGVSDLDIVVVRGKESLTKNYNEGMKRSRYKLKFFIHDDVDIMDKSGFLFFKIESYFHDDKNLGLLGLCGTTNYSEGWWWDAPKESLVGQVMVGGDINQHWVFNIDKEFYPNVNLVDGQFMVTDKDVPFSEDIKGFHLYDNDYSNTIRSKGYNIGVLTHLVRHEAYKKDLSGIDFEYYRTKWELHDV